MNLILGRWPLVALLAAATMLAAAHAFETFGGLPPCALCLRQREVYWVVLAVAAAALLARRLRPIPTAQRTVRRGFDALLALVFLSGAVVAAYHAGVEWRWWPGPTTCTGGGEVNAADLGALVSGGQARRVVMCDEAAWTFGPLSMAGWNAVISLALAALSAAAALWKPRR